MPFHFTEPRGRECLARSAGGEETLQLFENHFSKKWPFSKAEEDTLKRFFVQNPDGRTTLIHYLDKNPAVSLSILSFELLSPHDIVGANLFTSKNYRLIEDLHEGLILLEQNTCSMDLMKYVF